MTHPISHNLISLAVCLLFLLVTFPNGCWGWERAEGGTQQQEQEHSSSSSATKEEEESMVNQVHIAAKLKEVSSNGISNDDALSIAGLLDALMVDEETRELVKKLQADDANNGSQDPQLQAFLDEATPKDIVIGLKQLIGELRGIEYLFQDPERAVEEMYKEGMFKESQLGLYRENPAQLAQDVESGLYFSFVTLAVAGGLL